MVPEDGFEPPTRGFSIHGQQAKTMTYRILSNFVSKSCFRWTRGFCGDRGDRCLDVAASNGVYERVVVKRSRVREMLMKWDFPAMREGSNVVIVFVCRNEKLQQN